MRAVGAEKSAFWGRSETVRYGVVSYGCGVGRADPRRARCDVSTVTTGSATPARPTCERPSRGLDHGGGRTGGGLVFRCEDWLALCSARSEDSDAIRVARGDSDARASGLCARCAVKEGVGL
jgi:hypothetical protein